MNKKTSEKVLIAGAIAGGAYLIYKTFNPEANESGEGSFGGSDDQFEDDLLEQQGFDIDPNSVEVYDPNSVEVYDPYEVIDETTNIPIDTPIITDPNPSDSGSSNNDGGYTYIPPTDAIDQAGDAIAGGQDPAITLPQYGLGVIGLTGSYFSAFGKNLLKTSSNIAEEGGQSILKRTAKTGIADIPFIGKNADNFVFGGSNKVFKIGGEQVGESALKIGGEQLAESAFKAGAKRTAKVGVGLIPFVGTVAGAEFDVAVSDRPRVLAYGANIFGDILGALAVAGGALIGVSETGVGAVALGVGGQIAGEQVVYAPYDLITGRWKDVPLTEEEEEQDNIDYNRQVAMGGTMLPAGVGSIDFSPVIKSSRSSSGSSGGSGNSSIFSNVSSVSKAVTPTVTSSNGSRTSSSSSRSSSSGINTSRFTPQSGGGYSDNVAKQSVSSSVALSRSSGSSSSSRSSSSSSSSKNYFSSYSSYSAPKKTSSSSNSSSSRNFSSYSVPKTNTSSSSRVSSNASSSSSRSTPKTTPKSSFVSRSVSSVKSTVSKVRSWFRRK